MWVQAPCRVAGVIKNSSLIAVGDFSVDNFPDVVTTGGNGGDSVFVMFGTGAGGFGPATVYQLNAAVYDVTLGDFNGDNKLDIAVATSNGVRVLLNNGNGTFGAVITYGTAQYFQIVAGNLNGGGTLDLLAINSNNPSIDVLLGNGDGEFQPPVSYAVPTSSYNSSTSLVLADFNSDNVLDAAVLTSDNNTNFALTMLTEKGDGTFNPPQAILVTQANPDYVPTYVAGADLNGDGKADLLLMDPRLRHD